MKRMRLLHITAHLGGGIGKVLSRLVSLSEHRRDGVQHVIACLEAPEKMHFVEHARAHGGEVLICPVREALAEAIASADIVQLEWWHHPAVAAWLGEAELPDMRLVIWSHISGLHVPTPPPAFIAAPHRFLFTSPCSHAAPLLNTLPSDTLKRVDTVFSSGGFADLPEITARPIDNPLRAGYLGTLNFAKLHPHLLDFIAAVDTDDFCLALVGDPSTGESLLNEAARRGLTGRIEIRGYRDDVAAELAGFNVFAYLLNPSHYGTTENALLEAMAMGVVPVVLDNPAERCLVRNGETGLIVDSPRSFAAAMHQLASDPQLRERLSRAANREVRTRFAGEHMVSALHRHYLAVAQEEKRRWDFRKIFGETPADWFRACLGAEAWRFQDDGLLALDGQPPQVLFERSKGSVHHFHRNFPDDPRLIAWSRACPAI